MNKYQQYIYVNHICKFPIKSKNSEKYIHSTIKVTQYLKLVLTGGGIGKTDYLNIEIQYVNTEKSGSQYFSNY